MTCAALAVSLFSAVIAVLTFRYAVWVMRWSRRNTEEWREYTEEQMKFLGHLIVNSAPDPDTVRRMVEDYSKVGKFQAEVFKDPHGPYYHLKYSIDLKGQISVSGRVKPDSSKSST